MSDATAVFFISFGGPEKREDIFPFLEIVTRGRGIPRERLEEVAHHYEAIGGASPINAITRRQATGLRKILAENNTPLPVYIGHRNWHPFIEDTLRQMSQDGVQKAVGFITAAHRAEASFERYLRVVEEAQQKIGALAPVIDYVDPWFHHPLFIEAICERIQEVLSGDGGTKSALIFTAHSIPAPMAAESNYVGELRRTAELVCEQLRRDEWSLAYSSRSGKPTDPWLEPDVCHAIQDKAAEGQKDIVIAPIGFVADHVEVLFDLDVEAKEAAEKSGVRLRRAPTVGEHPKFLAMMADVVQKRLRAPSRSTATRS
jgi:protoporphyrin/coproporphyrin ferrochelatase